jgi:hypothetical protein
MPVARIAATRTRTSRGCAMPNNDKKRSRRATACDRTGEAERVRAGTQRGSRRKIGESFITELYQDWQRHGKAAIAAARKSYPTGYLRLVGSLLPKTLDVEEDALDKLTDVELDALIAGLQTILAAAGKSEATATETPD